MVALRLPLFFSCNYFFCRPSNILLDTLFSAKCLQQGDAHAAKGVNRVFWLCANIFLSTKKGVSHRDTPLTAPNRATANPQPYAVWDNLSQIRTTPPGQLSQIETPLYVVNVIPYNGVSVCVSKQWGSVSIWDILPHTAWRCAGSLWHPETTGRWGVSSWESSMISAVYGCFLVCFLGCAHLCAIACVCALLQPFVRYYFWSIVRYCAQYWLLVRYCAYCALF